MFWKVYSFKTWEEASPGFVTHKLCDFRQTTGLSQALLLASQVAVKDGRQERVPLGT